MRPKPKTNTDDPRAALRAAVAGKRMAQRRLGVAADRVHRAAQILEQARTGLELRANGQKGLQAENARALEQWVRRGQRGERPQPVSDPAGERDRQEAEANVAAAERVVERLREAEAAATAQHSAAAAKVREARGRVVGTRVAEIVAELQGMWARERELMALVAAIGPDSEAALYLPRSIDEVRCPPARPTIEDMVSGGHVVHGIHSPIGGQRDMVDRAQDYWRSFIDAAERDAAETNTAQQAQEAAA